MTGETGLAGQPPHDSITNRLQAMLVLNHLPNRREPMGRSPIRLFRTLRRAPFAVSLSLVLHGLLVFLCLLLGRREPTPTSPCDPPAGGLLFLSSEPIPGASRGTPEAEEEEEEGEPLEVSVGEALAPAPLVALPPQPASAN